MLDLSRDLQNRETKSQATMHIRCPHCHNPVEVVDDSDYRDFDCPSCGSHFNLVGRTTEEYKRPERKIAQFTLSDRLGMGAFGTVFKAHDTTLDRTVAIKIPRDEQLSADEREKFLREARAAAQLKHPNIVAVHEVGRSDDTIYIVSDYIEGVTLQSWLTANQFSVEEAVETRSQDRESGSLRPRARRNSSRPETWQHHARQGRRTARDGLRVSETRSRQDHDDHERR